MDYDIDREMMADFIDESLDSFTVIPGLFLDLESHPDNLQLVEAIFRPVHSLKGNAAYFGLMKTKNLAHELESVLDMVRKNRLAPTKEIIDILLSGTDQIVSILEHTRAHGAEEVDEDHYEKLRSQINDLTKKDTGVPLGPIAPECKWTELEQCIRQLRVCERLQGTPEMGVVERIAVLVGELHPNSVGLKEEPILSGNILKTLENLAYEAAEDEEALVERVNTCWEPLLEMAESEEARHAIREAMTEFQLMAPKILMDELVRELLLELVDKVSDMQIWGSEEPAVDDPIKALLAIAAEEPEKGKEKELTEEVRAIFDTMESRVKVQEAGRVLTKAREEFELFVGNIGFDPMLREALKESAEILVEHQEWGDEAAAQAPVPQSKPQSIPPPKPPEIRVEASPEETSPQPEIKVDQKVSVLKETPRRESREPARTMRVSEDSIDSFLGYVGELIAVDEMFRYIHSVMVREDIDLALTSDFLRVVNTFTKLSDDLQASIMEIRKVSMKPMLQKTQRIVRDIASNHDKKIDTAILGEDVMIDRSLLDTLEAPVVHMVRNGADHGIESPEDRMMSGKGETGHINISVKEAEDEIVLTIADDGRGLNYERIHQKAVKLGLLQEDEAVPESRLADLIFSSGFSTAEKVTDVSGRGVGMDAVKRAVEDAGGRIELESVAGEGTTFKIHLPKTVGTQILGSFVVSIEEERFVVPMDRISGSFKAHEEMFHAMPDSNICVRRGELILPVVDLDGPVQWGKRDFNEGILIVMESKIKPFAFFVDSILGMQKVVLRSIPWFEARKFLGAAIMGDGRVSMIINVGSLEEMVV